jgi:hypothetical protein
MMRRFGKDAARGSSRLASVRENKTVKMFEIDEERVVWNEVFYAETFDFRSRLN